MIIIDDVSKDNTCELIKEEIKRRSHSVDRIGRKWWGGDSEKYWY